MVGDYAKFLTEFVFRPQHVGAVAPSSRGLANQMLSWIDWKHVSTVIEYGPGTGVVTRCILEYMRPEAKLMAIEINPRFAAMLQERFPDVSVFRDSVANVAQLCETAGVNHVDAIVSGLPWSVFSERDQDAYLDAMMTVLRPGGQFATFAYLQGVWLPAGRRFQRRLFAHFSEVRRSRVVWKNLPPAFVYQCRK